MKKNVIISIKGVQSYNDDNGEVELITIGDLYKKNNDFYVVYKESELTGLEGKTVLKIEKDKLTLTRNNRASQMIFEPNIPHTNHYDMGDGAFQVIVKTRKLDTVFSESGGNINVKYDLNINNFIVSQNYLDISVKEVPNVDKSN